MFFRKPDEMDSEYPSPLDLPGCGKKWTLNQFYNVFDKLIPGDYQTECSL